MYVLHTYTYIHTYLRTCTYTYTLRDTTYVRTYVYTYIHSYIRLLISIHCMVYISVMSLSRLHGDFFFGILRFDYIEKIKKKFKVVTRGNFMKWLLREGGMGGLIRTHYVCTYTYVYVCMYYIHTYVYIHTYMRITTSPNNIFWRSWFLDNIALIFKSEAKWA